jgi:hypothetical protein
MKDLLHMLVPVPKEIRLKGGSCPWNEASVEEVVVEGFGDEEYRLVVSDHRILLEATGPRGFFYGRKTLDQLKALTTSVCPCLEIGDEPDNRVRGYMLDISRCKVPQMSHLFRLVDLLASFKYNQLQLYTEHTFAYAGHEEVWKDASPMSPQEIRALGAYCADRYIELVPNQNAFGHMERWLRHPRYQHLAESPDGFEHPVAGWKPHGSVLFPCDESIEFVDGLLDQLLPCFNSKWIHLGCDEPWELGQGRSEERVEELGRHSVFKEHVLKLHGLVERRGKQMLFWSDELREHPDRIGDFPDDVVPVAWGYEPDHSFDNECKAFAKEDYTFLIAPGDSSWNSFTGRLKTCARNIENAARSARRHGAEGMLLTSWGDQGHQQVWPTQLPGLVLFASLAWNLDGLHHVDLPSALDRFVFKDDSEELGSFWVNLAMIDSHIPVKLNPLNSSFPYDAVHASKAHLRHAVRKLPPDAFFRSLSYLEECEKQLARANPQCDDGAWLIKESALALMMTRHGLKRAEFLNKYGDFDTGFDDWNGCLDMFRQCWLKRNRKGGLQESLDRLSLEKPHYHA